MHIEAGHNMTWTRQVDTPKRLGPAGTGTLELVPDADPRSNTYMRKKNVFVKPSLDLIRSLVLEFLVGIMKYSRYTKPFSSNSY